jgi:hypothetical protein
MAPPNDITPPSETRVWEFLRPNGPSPWHTGENRAADDAMSAARAAGEAGDALRCFGAMRVAMQRFGQNVSTVVCVAPHGLGNHPKPIFHS